MDLTQLLLIIEQGEGLRTEFKEATDSVPASFYETVVSFSNTDGGTILLGVEDHGAVIGINTRASVKLQKDDASDHLAAGLKNIALPASLAKAGWEEVLLYLVPGWHQKGTQLLKKKAWYLISILSLCSKPIGMNKLLDIFDYKNEKSFRDNYIKPLREVGFIVLTKPENPTDPENKYIITGQGKIFLAGQSGTRN